MKSYQKILHLGDKMLDRLLEGEVEIQEKLDGSLIRWTIHSDGNIEIGSKRMEFNVNGIEKNFVEGANAIKEQFKNFAIDQGSTITIFGEYLKSPKQNTLAYERIPKNHIMVFDVVVSNPIKGDQWMNYGDMKQFSELNGFESVPILYQGDGKTINQDFINKLLETKSVLGNELVEGIVVKNKNQYYDANKYPWLSGNWQSGKYVRKEFQERNHGEHAGEKSGIEGLKISYGGAARWNKAIYRLRDEGKLQYNMKDMVVLLEEVKRDIIEEEKENIKEELWNIYNRQILGSAISGLGEWYKQKLLEELNKK